MKLKTLVLFSIKISDELFLKKLYPLEIFNYMENYIVNALNY